MHNKNYHILEELKGQGHRSKVKVTKVKNVKIEIFGLFSERKVKATRVKVTNFKISKVKVKGWRVNVKAISRLLYPIDSQ